jgi:hypothetical protein
MLRERVSFFFFPAAIVAVIVIALVTDMVLSSAGSGYCCGARSKCSTAK